MHTFIVVAVGFAALGIMALGGRVLGGSVGVPTVVLAFVPPWLIGAGVNMYFGVDKAGYSVAAEAPVFLVVFTIPAAAALVVWSKVR